MRNGHKVLALVLALSLLGCSAGQNSDSRGIYLLLDTSGTYTEELTKARQLINYLLLTLKPGDSFAVARIDSASFSEKDIVAKITLDPRPSTSNRQKREFAAEVESFVAEVQSSAYTDITGGLLQAVEFLNEAAPVQKEVLIFSDLKQDLPQGYNRDFLLSLDGYQVKALNVTKLRSDNVNPEEYLGRVASWRQQVESSGGQWAVVNDLEGYITTH